jgi:uncharacterized protein
MCDFADNEVWSNILAAIKNERGPRSAVKLLSKDEARRIGTNVVVGGTWTRRALRQSAHLLRATLTASLILGDIAAGAVAGPFDDAYAAYLRGDYATAFRLLRPLVDQGSADAQDILAVMYFVGDGMPQNRAEAIRLYRLAAEQGNAHAQDTLGFVYLDGVGAQQDYAEAAKWFRMAADQGNIDAQFNLGGMYELGNGVPQDYVLAHMWFELGASQGTGQYAIESRERVEKQMTSAQIAEARKLAREWKPKPKPSQ